LALLARLDPPAQLDLEDPPVPQVLQEDRLVQPGPLALLDPSGQLDPRVPQDLRALPDRLDFGVRLGLKAPQDLEARLDHEVRLDLRVPPGQPLNLTSLGLGYWRRVPDGDCSAVPISGSYLPLVHRRNP
jgi:hypothetical protein